MGVSEESIEAKCARYRAERDLARQDADWLRAKIDECVARGMGGEAAGLSVEDAEAARWVRGQGGLKVVKTHAELFAGLKEQRDEYRDLCRSYEKRLMPEGMEWPRFEDGEPVKLGDAFAYGDETFYVDSVQLLRREFHLWATNGTVATGSNGERCERPAPEVLDADGAEIRVGDKVWSTRGPESGTVVYAYPLGDSGQPSVKVGAVWRHASELTHRAPVLAADGLPLREGETVWATDDGIRYEFRNVNVSEDGRILVRPDYSPYDEYIDPSLLTHERPDSWERLEEDATLRPSAYCHDRCLPCAADPDPDAATYVEAMARDIVRRAKALAERDA